MEHHDLTELDHRLRAARPRSAAPDPGAVDLALLDRVRRQPVARRRRVGRAAAAPLAAGGVTLAVAAAVMLGGGPGAVGGPSSAEAISQALRWLDPTPGTVLHARAVETQGGRTRVIETWQSGDDPSRTRIIDDAGEVQGTANYDPATDTIYAPQVAPGKPDAELPPGDGVVAKVRTLLSRGDMEVEGPVDHAGTSAWRISLRSGAGRPPWALWVSAADGRPLELRDPGRDAGEAPQTIRWTAYELVGGADAERQTTLRGAHPSARVVETPAPGAGAEIGAVEHVKKR